MKHDKVLSKKVPAPHLRDVPEYLLDQKTRDASKMVKLASAAMGNNNSARRQKSKKKFRKSRDPLKTFSAEVIDICCTEVLLYRVLLLNNVAKETVDHLFRFWLQGPKAGGQGRMKRGGKDTNDTRKQKRQKSA